MKRLDQVLKSGFPKLPVTANSWFHGTAFCEALNERSFPYVIEVKSNRIIESHGRSKKAQKVKGFFDGRTRKAIFSKTRPKHASEAVVTLKDSTSRIKIVAVANRAQLDEEFFAYYVPNELTWMLLRYGVILEVDGRLRFSFES